MKIMYNIDLEKKIFFKIKYNIFDMLSKEQLVYDDEFN